MQHGYIKLHRCILDSSWSRYADFMAVWVHCLLRGNYVSSEVPTKGGEIVHLEPGEFITSRLQISIATGVQESKVERILKVFKNEQQIEQRSMGKFRVISICNWSKYQQCEQDIEQQLNDNRTTDEQQMNTDKKVKKVKKEPNPELIEFFNQLWEVYPRKIGKPSALKHYLKTVKTDNDMDRINNAMYHYLQSVQNTDVQYIKHGSTWFNSWQDWEAKDDAA